MISLVLRSLLLAFAVLLSAPAGAQVPGLPAAAAEEPAAEADVQAALDQLIVVLEDDAAREALITELRASEAASAGEAAPAAEQTESLAIGAEIRSFGGQIADRTGEIIDSAVLSGLMLVEQVAALPAAFAGISASDYDFFGWLIVNLTVLVLVTYGGLALMSLVTNRLRRRLRVTIRHEGFFTKVIAVVATLAIDVVRVLVPWALGYGVALLVLGQTGQVAYQHRLYLNAFLFLELALAVLRLILSPQREEARIVTLHTPQAKAVMLWSRIILSVLAFGQLLLLPLLARNVSAAAGRAVAVLGLALVLVLLGLAVLRMRLFIAKKLVRAVGISRSRRSLRMMARYWHVPVLIYLVGLFLVALSRPVDGFYTVIWANAQIAIAVGIGLLVVNVISRMIGAGISLPPALKLRVPLLEERLNAFIPRALWVLRALVIVIVVAWCLHLFGVFNFVAFLESEVGARLSGATITIIAILVVGFILWLVMNSWVDYRINPSSALAVSARERTLLVLLRNAVTIALFVIILMFVLSEIGINIAPLLASAGVIGLAIGFGSQRLVQDIITGVFIQLEGAIDVGDVVRIGGVTGTVERLTVRSAGLRDADGSYHLVPFSSVDIVSNLVRGYSVAIMDISVAYHENSEKVRKAMFDAFDEVARDPVLGANIIGVFDWAGIERLAPNEAVFRGSIRTKAGKQWGVKRAFHASIKRIFDERHIAVPNPNQSVLIRPEPLALPAAAAAPASAPVSADDDTPADATPSRPQPGSRT